MGRLLSVRKNKQDTPMKMALFRKIGLKKLMEKRIYEALPEECEVGHVPPVQPMVLETEADTGAEGSNGSDSSLSLVDTSYTSDEQRSPVDTSSSLPSPEVFREDQYVEPCTFRLDDDLSDVLHPLKNSTLLDLSRAETILMHQPPDLSTITDAPTILAENSPQEISRNGSKPSDGCKKARTPARLHMKKRIFVKKRVWFRNALFSEKSSRKSESANPKTKKSNDEIPQQNEEKRGEEHAKEHGKEHGEERVEERAEEHGKEHGEERVEERAEEHGKEHGEERVEERAEEHGKEHAEEHAESDGGVFFAFASDAQRDGFFRRMTERCLKLKNAAVFPSTAARQKN